jgi:hypothetical protein
MLRTLYQLCSSQETLPKPCILPIELETTDPPHAKGGFADVWKVTHDGRDLAFKVLRLPAQVDGAALLRFKVRHDIFLRTGHIDEVYCLSEIFVKRLCYGNR